MGSASGSRSNEHDALTAAEIADLAERWRRARLSALRACVPERPDGTEPELLAAALDRDAERLLRAVYEHGLLLGGSFRRFYRLDLPLADVVKVLPRLGAPCFAASWTRADEPAYIAARTGCASCAWHAQACDYWREAGAGLVLGLTDGVLLARHDSVGHGGARCVDVVYTNPRSALRFGPIPDDVRAGLEAVRRLARGFDSSVDVTFLGISENVLHYELAPGRGPFRLGELVERELRRRFPRLALRDSSPRPVPVEGDR